LHTAIHITHEAAKKIGGIGSVLSGICTSESYLKFYDKTYFYGPLFDDNIDQKDRLGSNAKILFSSLDKIYNSSYDNEFNELIERYHIDLVYGQKIIFDEIHPEKKSTIEIILLGIKNIRKDLLDIFKFQLWEIFKFNCQLYETDWDFEQYLRIALPLRSILSIVSPNSSAIDYFSHEYMGVCSCLSILKDKKANERLFFYAHEVSTARVIVESHQGHDISFYNILQKDLGKLSLEERFGSQKHNSRNELIKYAKYFDKIFAVGNWVEKEYKYLVPDTEPQKIIITYNGIPINEIDYQHKLESRAKIQQYCNNLFNFTPDIIMTHVTRLVISKGLWRDISLLEQLDKYFHDNHLKGFFILLSSQIGTGRESSDIYKMEDNYGWPIWHKENWPDLVGYENDIFWSVNYFNAKSKNIKAVFINQFGFTQEQTGQRIPEDTKFSDLRIASDAEFGMSIYEPFGIAQIETVPYGGIAVLSRACGSSFLLENVWNKSQDKPFHIIDFAGNSSYSKDYFHLNSDERTLIEKEILKKEAKSIFNKLPKTDNDRKKLFEVCINLSSGLEWESISKNIFKEDL
jgi:hypothetical protein